MSADMFKVKRELKARLGEGLAVTYAAWDEMLGLYHVHVKGPDGRRVVHSFPPVASVESTVEAILEKLDLGKFEPGVRDG